jgi:hypothetical protein
MVGTNALERGRHARPAFDSEGAVAVSDRTASRVEETPIPGLRVDDRDEPDIWE